MSEVRLVLRDAAREISGVCHGSTADHLIAALSAEPETIAELEKAVEHFYKRGDGHSFLGWFAPGVDDEPYDAGVVIVDLAARLIACESTYSSPGRYGFVLYHDGRAATDLQVNYHLPDDWTIVSDVLDWRARAEELRRQRLRQPPLDAREVLYGRPLLEFIAAACFERFGRAAVANNPPTVEEGKVVDVPLEATYRTAFAGIAARWRRVLEAERS
ncbi:MAG TPA: hypothetical protein VF278_10655 [Pirellulales bacterium]